jgi:chemotaxis protein histidine kinase CheA
MDKTPKAGSGGLGFGAPGRDGGSDGGALMFSKQRHSQSKGGSGADSKNPMSGGILIREGAKAVDHMQRGNKNAPRGDTDGGDSSATIFGLKGKKQLAKADRQEQGSSKAGPKSVGGETEKSALQKEVDMKKNLMARMMGGAPSSSSSMASSSSTATKGLQGALGGPLQVVGSLVSTKKTSGDGKKAPGSKQQQVPSRLSSVGKGAGAKLAATALQNSAMLPSSSTGAGSSIFDRLRTATGDKVSHSTEKAREEAAATAQAFEDDEDEEERDDGLGYIDDVNAGGFISGNDAASGDGDDDDDDDGSRHELSSSDDEAGDGGDVAMPIPAPFAGATRNSPKAPASSRDNSSPFVFLKGSPPAAPFPASDETQLRRERRGSNSGGDMLSLLKSKMAAESSKTDSADADWPTPFSQSVATSFSAAPVQQQHPLETVNMTFSAHATMTRSGSTGGNGGGGGAVVPLCEDMCADAERVRRLESDDLDKFEKPEAGMSLPGHPGTGPGGAYSHKDLMVKKLAKSSADHTLQRPAEMRTPAALLRTIRYLEQCVMDTDSLGPDPRFIDAVTDSPRAPTFLEIYFFVFSRMRMIAKDFILQSGTDALDDTGADAQGSGSTDPNDVFTISPVWVEVHERIARYYIICENYMRRSEEYVEDHAQQNGEQLNNVFKTLLQYYVSPAGLDFPKPNRAEFTSYFLLGQLGNTGEVAKFLRNPSIPSDVLRSPEIAFVMQVWGSLKTDDFARFFRLLRSANLLQACMMMKYVGEVRMMAMQRLCTALCPPGKPALGSPGTPYPLKELVYLLFFEDDKDALAWLSHCCVEVIAGGDDGALQVMLKKTDIIDQLPLDKNGHPIMPQVSHLALGIDSKRGQYSLMEACRGICNGAIPFNDEGFLGGGSTSSSNPASIPLDLRAAAPIFTPGASAKAAAEVQRQKEQQTLQERQQAEQQLILQRRREKEDADRRKEEQRRAREAALKAAEEAAAAKEKRRKEDEEAQKARERAAEESRKRREAEAARIAHEKAVKEKQDAERRASEAAAAAEAKRKVAKEEERRRLAAEAAAKREREEALAREAEIRRREDEQRRREEEARRKREEEERLRKEKAYRLHLERAESDAHAAMHRATLKIHFAKMFALYAKLLANKSAEKRRKLMEELRSIDMSDAFAGALSLEGSSDWSSPQRQHPSLGLTTNKKMRTSLDTMARGDLVSRGPLHHPRQKIISLRYLTTPSVATEARAVMKAICDIVSPSLLHAQTQLLRDAQRSTPQTSLFWRGNLYFKVALITGGSQSSYWDLGSTMTISGGGKRICGDVLICNLLRLVCGSSTSSMESVKWSDEEELSSQFKSNDEGISSHASNGAFFATQVPFAAHIDGGVGGRGRTASMASTSSSISSGEGVSMAGSSEGFSTTLGHRSRIRSRKSVGSTTSKQAHMKQFRDHMNLQQSHEVALSVSDACGVKEDVATAVCVGARVIVIIMPRVSSAIYRARLVETITTLLATNVDQPIAIVITGESTDGNSERAFHSSPLEPTDCQVIDAMMEVLGGNLAGRVASRVQAVCMVTVNSSFLDRVTSQCGHSQLDSVLACVEQCDSNALKTLGESFVSLCRTIVEKGAISPSVPLIHPIRMADKLCQLAMPIIRLHGTSYNSANAMSSSVDHRALHERPQSVQSSLLDSHETQEEEHVHMLLHQLAYGNMNDTDPHYSFNSAVITVLEQSLKRSIDHVNAVFSDFERPLNELADAEAIGGGINGSVVLAKEFSSSLKGVVFVGENVHFRDLPPNWSHERSISSAMRMIRCLTLPQYQSTRSNGATSSRNVLEQFSESLAQWTQLLVSRHDKLAQFVAGVSADNNILQGRLSVLLARVSRTVDSFTMLLSTCVSALKSDEVAGAPYSLPAELCSRHVIKAIYAAVESFMEGLLKDSCDVASFADDGQEVYLASLPIPRPLYWDRAQTPAKSGAASVNKKRHYTATLANSAADTWTAKKRVPADSATGVNEEEDDDNGEDVDAKESGSWLVNSVQKGVESERSAHDRLDQIVRSALSSQTGSSAQESSFRRGTSEYDGEGDGEGDGEKGESPSPRKADARYSVESLMASPMLPYSPPNNQNSKATFDSSSSPSASASLPCAEEKDEVSKDISELLRACREERRSFESSIFKTTT